MTLSLPPAKVVKLKFIIIEVWGTHVQAVQARPLSIGELYLIFSSLKMEDSEDLALWCAILLCFRGLLRKSNVVEEGLALLV